MVKKSVLPLICGVLCGDLIAMSLSLFGVGALLSASATLFGIVKWLGAAYLVYLGIKAWCTKVEISSVKPKESQPINSKTVFRDSLMVTALNPKGIVFFMAFLPLFINAESKVLPQMLIFVGIIFSCLCCKRIILCGVFWCDKKSCSLSEISKLV